MIDLNEGNTIMLKKHFITALLLSFCGTALAGGPLNMNLFFPMRHHALPTPVEHKHKHHHPLVIVKKAAVIYPGSLKNNITRIASGFGWDQVVWKLPSDYQWVGKTRIVAHNMQGIFQKLLSDYPVQAVFYRGNHILLIRPRTLS
ncbi:MAG: toxin co-regulated pilus biosynthesis Q family protein [Gammaproteobacteria bacterium]|nr:toxin co-regulated pilus biosynthesis Q family protein [Gammaproteobacteria bacterium]